jgi:hypothetical protein
LTFQTHHKSHCLPKHYESWRPPPYHGRGSSQEKKEKKLGFGAPLTKSRSLKNKKVNEQRKDNIAILLIPLNAYLAIPAIPWQ